MLVVVSVAEDSSVSLLLGRMSPGIRAHTLTNICINHNTKFAHNWLAIDLFACGISEHNEEVSKMMQYNLAMARLRFDESMSK